MALGLYVNFDFVDMALSRIAYVSIFFLQLGFFIINIVAYNRIDWVVVRTPDNFPLRIHNDYGLTQECDSFTGHCYPFPPTRDCQHRQGASISSLCFQWHTAAYLYTLSVVMGILLLFSLFAILIGGRAKRETGWKVVVGLQAAFISLQTVTIALVANQVGQGGQDSNDPTGFGRFYAGSSFGWAFILAIINSGGTLLISVGMGVAASLYPPEYQRIAG